MQARKIPTHQKKHNRPLRAVQDPGTGKWRVEMRIGGKRKRKAFTTKQAADQFIAGEEERRRNLGQSAAGISPRFLEDALNAEEILRPYGATLTTAAEFFAEVAKRRETSKTALEVATELVANRRANGCSMVHLNDLEDRLIGGGKRSNASAFCRMFGAKSMSEITTADVEKWLAGLRRKYAAQTVVNFRRAAQTLFNFATPRGYCPRNVVEAIQPPRITPKDGVGIFTPAEAEAILHAADKDLSPWLAIAFFAGLRSAELDRLTWNDVKFKQNWIEVPAAKSKTAQRRLVTMVPALAAWLAPYQDREGGIRPKNFILKRLRAYRAAGFAKPGTESAEEKAAGIRLRVAPSNAARHSFASYRLADTNDAAKTALELGHTSTTLLFSTYREVATAEDAARYFAILPKGETANVVPFPRAAATA
jgi:integrase